MSSSTSSTTTTSKYNIDAKPRFRGAWTPVIHDSTPVVWSYEVRNASNVLNGLTSNIRVQQQPFKGKPSASSTTTTTAEATTASATPASQLSQLSINEKDDSKSTKQEQTTTTPSPPSTTISSPSTTATTTSATATTTATAVAPASKTAKSDAFKFKKAEEYTDLSSFAADIKKLVDIKIEEQKVEQHNETITELATNLVEYEMTHGEVEAANKRVADMEKSFKGKLSKQQLVDHIIKTKCIQAALVGLIIGGCASIPGLGTITAIILGAAADGALTTKLQVDMVLEIGCALGQHEKLKDPKYRRDCLLLSAGLIKKGADGKDIFYDANTNDPLTTEAGHRVSEKTLEELGTRSFLYFIPVVGAVTASATDLSWTYVIGRRAEEVFKEEADVPDWSVSVIKHTGVDSVGLANWVVEAIELPIQQASEKIQSVSAQVVSTIKHYASTNP